MSKKQVDTNVSFEEKAKPKTKKQLREEVRQEKIKELGAEKKALKEAGELYEKHLQIINSFLNNNPLIDGGVDLKQTILMANRDNANWEPKNWEQKFTVLEKIEKEKNTELEKKNGKPIPAEIRSNFAKLVSAAYFADVKEKRVKQLEAELAPKNSMRKKITHAVKNKIHKAGVNTGKTMRFFHDSAKLNLKKLEKENFVTPKPGRSK